jgi:uncharacterized protein (TIGR03067 family)
MIYLVNREVTLREKKHSMRVGSLIMLVGVVGPTAGCGNAEVSVTSTTESPEAKSQKPDTSQKVQSEFEAVQGEWAIFKIDAPEGSPRPANAEEQLRTLSRTVTFTVRGKLITVRKQGGEVAPFHEALYGVFTIDTNKEPKQLDITETDENGNRDPNFHGELPPGKGEVWMGLYKLEGGILTIALPAKPGEPRPTELKPIGRIGLVHLKKK